MTQDLPELGPEYEAQVMWAVMNAALDAATPEGQEGSGFVDPDRTFAGMCNAIGMMAQRLDIFESPGERRAFAERCRKRILDMMKQMDRLQEEGQIDSWAKPTRLDRN